MTKDDDDERRHHHHHHHDRQVCLLLTHSTPTGFLAGVLAPVPASRRISDQGKLMLSSL